MIDNSRVIEPVQEMGLPPVETVDFVDLERYDGLWYEVAKTRNFFSVGCFCTTANYEIIDESSISVFNSCNQWRPRGSSSTIEGVATVTDPETNAKLEINFDGVPFPGEYWILDLVEDPNDPTGDYTYAVVGESTRTNLFILSRTPDADPEVLEELYTGLEEQFYDTDELIRSPQPSRCGCAENEEKSTVTELMSDGFTFTPEVSYLRDVFTKGEIFPLVDDFTASELVSSL